jgi:putative ABC transport system permease protein
MEDFESIAALSLVGEAAPGVEGAMRVKAGSHAMVTKVLGTNAAFPSVRRFRLRSGRFFDSADDGERVAVLGARVAETLFPGQEPAGEVVRLRGVPFDVLGVLEAKGGMADGGDEDNQILIPIRTALRRVFNVTWLSTVFVSVREPLQMDRAQVEIERLLRERHGSDDFAVQNTAKSRSMQAQMANTLTLLTSGIAGLALLVGGTGILGLMLLTVKERTGEIGLRMAVGAKPADVFLQFLLEAMLLAVGGWLSGVAIGSLGAAAVALGTSWKIGLPVEALFMSLATTLAIGFGFGAFPARKAARLTPIEALAVE